MKQYGNTEEYSIGIRHVIRKRDGVWFTIRKIFPGETEDESYHEYSKEISKEVAERVLKAPGTVEMW